MNTAYRLSRTVKLSGSTGVSYLFVILGVLIGVLSFFQGIIIAGLILGSILFAIGCLVEPKYQHISYCEACGNEVAPTSKHCPHCHTDLIAAPHRRRRMSPILLGTFIFIALIGLFFLWLKLRS